jgi:hypothetical protein
VFLIDEILKLQSAAHEGVSTEMKYEYTAGIRQLVDPCRADALAHAFVVLFCTNSMDTGTKIFVSVGQVANDQQDQFIRSIEDRLRAEALIPQTVGRNVFSADRPLITIKECMDSCSGVVVVALERKFFSSGIERRGGPRETKLADIKLATPWNQIEAAMAYDRGIPLMVIVEEGVTEEGLLERGNDWYVQTVKPEPSALTSAEFNGVLASWKDKVQQRKLSTAKPASAAKPVLSDLTIRDLMTGLKPAQVWGLLVAFVTLVGGCVIFGAQFATKFVKP